MRLLALLVHRGLLSESRARGAFASGKPLQWLVEQGAVTRAQLEEWRSTEGGTRPRLSRYELGALLGEGGMARVFAATDRTDGREVALKVLRPELSQDPTQVDRFVKEAKLLLQLDHPHIVKGIRVAKEGAVFFFAMERLPGRTLLDELSASGRLPEEDALAIVSEVAQALAYLRAQGLVHRDVKPANMMWSEERGAVLIDLGFAVSSGTGPQGDSTAGTVHYIAPEQARGSGDLDVRADIYALGATLFHLVTGSLPFDASSGEEVMRKQVLESLSGERIRALSLSPQVHFFIEKMMAKEREIRFQSPEELYEAIESFLLQRQQERDLEQKANEQQRRPTSERASMFGRRRRPPGRGRRR